MSMKHGFIVAVAALGMTLSAYAAPKPVKAKAADAPANDDKPQTQLIKGKYISVDLRPSDYKILKSTKDFVGFLDAAYEKMHELTYASPPITYRGVKNLGAWGTAGEGGINLDWGVVEGCMRDFNNGKIEFGLIHEEGHCFDARSFPRWYITPRCGGETFGNIKLSYVVEMLLRKDNNFRIDFGPGGLQTGVDFNNRFYGPAGKEYLAGNKDWTEMSVDTLHAFYLELVRKYGWDVMKKWFRAYYVIEGWKMMAPPECNDPIRINVVCGLWSIFAGENLVPQFQKWRFPVTDASVNEVIKKYRLREAATIVDGQFTKEYAAGQITLDNKLSLQIRSEKGATKTTAKVTIFAVKINGATIRYTTDKGEPGPASKSFVNPFIISAPVTIKAALYVPGKTAPVLKVQGIVDPAKAGEAQVELVNDEPATADAKSPGAAGEEVKTEAPASN